MKNLTLLLLASIALVFVSCENNDTIDNKQQENFAKIITFQTYSNNPSLNTKNVKRFENFEVVSDSTFDYQDQFI